MVTLAQANTDMSRAFAWLFFGLLFAGLVWLGLQPGRIARKRGHPSAEAVNLCGLIGIVVLPALLVAFVWANTGKESAAGGSAPAAFEVVGVDRESGMDTRLVIEAASEGNARAKAELRGMVVTELRRAG